MKFYNKYLFYIIFFVFFTNIYSASYILLGNNNQDINSFVIDSRNRSGEDVLCSSDDFTDITLFPLVTSLPGANDDITICSNVVGINFLGIVNYRNIYLPSTNPDFTVMDIITDIDFPITNITVERLIIKVSTNASHLLIIERASRFRVLREVLLEDSSDLRQEASDFSHSDLIQLWCIENAQFIVGSPNVHSTFTLSNSTLRLENSSSAEFGVEGEITIIGKDDAIFKFNVNTAPYLRIGNPTTGRGSFILEDAALLPVSENNITDSSIGNGYGGVRYLIFYGHVFDLRPRTAGNLGTPAATGGLFLFQGFEIKFEGPSNSPPTVIDLTFSNLYNFANRVNANVNTKFKSIILNRPNLIVNLNLSVIIRAAGVPVLGANLNAIENVNVLQGTFNSNAFIEIGKTYNGNELAYVDTNHRLIIEEGLYVEGGVFNLFDKTLQLRNSLTRRGGSVNLVAGFVSILPDPNNSNINIDGEFRFSTLNIQNTGAVNHRTITFSSGTVLNMNTLNITGASANARIRLIGRDANNPFKVNTIFKSINNVVVQNGDASLSRDIILPLITSNIGTVESNANNNINLGNNIGWFQESVSIIKAVAEDSQKNPYPQISNGDTLTLTLNQPLDIFSNAILSKQTIDSIFNFSATLGIAYNATWKNRLTLVISIQNFTSGNAVIIDDVVNTLKVNIKNTATITGNWAGVSGLNTNEIKVTGDFGTLRILSFTADDPERISKVYNKGDTFTIMFNGNTNEPFGPKMHKEDVDKIFKFSQPLGNDYEGIWTAPNIFTIIMLETSLGNPKIGLTTATVLSSAKLSVQSDTPLNIIFTPTSPPLAGTFGKLLVNSLDNVKITPTLVRPSINPTIIFRDLPDNTHIQIYDVSERLLFQATSSDLTASYDLSTSFGLFLGSGIYLVLFTTNTDKKIVKFAVVR